MNATAETTKNETAEPEFDWDLYLSIARFIGPRLAHFRQNSKRLPDRMNHEEWARKLDSMVEAFTLIAADSIETPEQKQAIERGLKEFARHFQDLWY